MVEDDKNMDEAFVRMSEDFQVAYNESFWEDARINLENESLDSAFRAAADTGFVLPSITSLEDLDDAFMDDAFRDAALANSVTYSPSFWSDFQAVENHLQMDEAFQEAAQAVDVNYSPIFWEDANDELVKEGLHYEYTSAYWNEARVLLDQSDRRIFFARWSAVAILLILISFIGIGYQPDQSFVQKSAHINENQKDNGNNMHLTGGNAMSDLANTYSRTTQPIGLRSNVNTNSNEGSNLPNHSNLSATNFTNYGTNFTNVLVDQHGNEPNLNEHVNTNLTVFPDLTEGGLVENASHNTVQNNQLESTVFNHQHEKSNELSFVEHFPIHINQIPTNKIDESTLKATMVVIEPKPLTPSHSVSLLAGLGGGKSFGSTDLLLSKRIYGGLAYNHQGLGKFKKFDWGARVTVNYSAFDELEAENQSVNYKIDGSYSRSWSHVQMRESYYINPSIYASYRVNQKNILHVGIGMEQLVAVRSNMAYKLNDDLGIQTVNNNWGVKNGMKKQDFQVSLGYEFKIKDYLGLQMSMNCGMFDRTDDTFFRQLNVKDRETSLTFGLNYTIVRK